MTNDKLSETAALRALLSETPDTHLLAEMLGFVADRLMALDVEQLCGAAAHERSADRMNHRNGYRARSWETRLDSQTKCDTCYLQDRYGREIQPPHA